MSFQLLLVDGQGEAVTVPLRIRTLREFPAQEGVSVHFRPVRNDLLFESAKGAGALAYRILAGEGRVRSQLWVEYEVAAEPLNVVGRSSDLLFALALTTAAWKRETDEHLSIAATGVLDEVGSVQSVEHVVGKVAAAVRGAGASDPLVVFYPAADAALVDAWRSNIEVPSHVRLQPVARLEEALVNLGRPLEQVYLRNPFRGLVHFDFADHAIFFGRDREIQEVLAQLLRREEAIQPGILIEGASGCGKSSFLRAGVLPALVSGRAQTDFVRDALAARPISVSVAAAIWRPNLLPAADERSLALSIRDCWTQLPEFPSGCLERVKSLADLIQYRSQYWPSRQRFVWLIDQFEELFGAGLDAELLESFGRFLGALQVEGVWTLASIRADATPMLKTHDSLRRVFGSNEGEYYLATLKGPALDDVITRPAKAANLTFQVDAGGTPLDRRLREDVYRENNSLPLLQFTLNELYQKRIGSELTFAAYDALGGLAGSIATAAELVLGDAAKLHGATSRLFRSLVRVDETGRPMRRYAPLSELASDADVHDLLLRLVQARLCVTDQHDGIAVAALAHDALLSTVPALNEWLRLEAALLQTLDLARHDAREWQKHAQSDAWLAAADKLSTFAALEAADSALPETVGSFLRRSRQRVRRVNRLKQLVTASIVMLAVAAMIFGIRFKLERDAALRAERLAQQEALTARETSNFLVSMFKRVDPGKARGNSVTAREVLDRGAQQIQTQLNGQPTVRARMLRTIGEVYGSLGLRAQSQTLLQQALQAASQPGVSSAVDIATVKQTLGAELSDGEHYAEAETLLLDAMHTFDRNANHAGDSAMVRADLGYLYWSQTKYRLAQPVLEQGLKLAEARFGHKSEEVATLLSTLGLTVRDLGDPSRGLSLLQESADIYKAVSGEDYYWYGMARQNLGFTQMQLGRNEEAKANLAAGVKSLEHVLGPTHSFLGIGLQGLGAVESQLGQFDEAEQTLKRALAIEEVADGTDSIEVCRTLHYLAGALAAQRHFEQAIALEGRSSSIAKLKAGELSEEYIRRLASLGVTLRRAGRLEEARASLQQSLDLAERRPDAPVTLFGSLGAQADTLCFRGPDAQGFALAQRAIDLHATQLPIQLAVIHSTAAYCDPDRSHVAENEAALKSAVQELQTTQIPASPQTADAVRRLERFRQVWKISPRP